ncbi:MAG: peptidoglycan-binding domain-containing protein [Bryobacteraceae bacterium]
MRLSGHDWVSEYPNSTSPDDVAEPFRTNLKSFLGALAEAGAQVSIASTLRPRQRAYLMHFSFLIAAGATDASMVPTFSGVDIDWIHRDSEGQPDPRATRNAAREMVTGYAIVYAPALDSRHTQGLAADMDIFWSGNLTILNAHGRSLVISSTPRSGGNLQIQAIGATYGVNKLASDPPHWSADGH